MVSLNTKVAGDTSVMEDDAPNDVQILLTFKEDFVSMRTSEVIFLRKILFLLTSNHVFLTSNHVQILLFFFFFFFSFSF